MTQEEWWKIRFYMLLILTVVVGLLHVARLHGSWLLLHPPEIDILYTETLPLQNEINEMNRNEREQRECEEMAQRERDLVKELNEVYGHKCHWPDKYKN